MAVKHKKTKEQFERAKRHLKKIQQLHSGQNHTLNSSNYEDDIYTFFQNFWSIKDWAISSGEIKRQEANAFFHDDKDSDLKIARDLANGSKHLINKNPSIDKDLNSVARREYKLTLGGGVANIQANYWIKVDGHGFIDAVGLAEICIAKCEAFLKSKMILE